MGNVLRDGERWGFHHKAGQGFDVLGLEAVVRYSLICVAGLIEDERGTVADDPIEGVEDPGVDLDTGTTGPLEDADVHRWELKYGRQ